MGIVGSCRKPATTGRRSYTVGKKYDFKNDSISEVTVRNNVPILIAKYQGHLYAFGATCPHNGNIQSAPLSSGVLTDGKIRCPWHGACFDIKTGDIEDFPGLDCLPTYKVSEQKDGKVVVFCEDEMPGKAVRPLGKLTNKNKSIIIIGGGPAACIAAQTLRQNKYEGKITIISKEHHLPYDRTLISKGPGIEIAECRLRDFDYYKNGNIDVLNLSECERVDFKSKNVFIKNSTVGLPYDKLLIATGSKPKELDINGVDLKNIRHIYTIEDGRGISNEVEDKEIVIIGATFIGLELAWALRDVCAKISIISNSESPMAYLLGKNVASYIHKQALQTCAVLEFIGPDDIRGFVGNSHGEVTKVHTSRRGYIKAEYVVLTMWPVPNSDLCVSSSKMAFDESTNAIIVNQFMETSIKNVYASGDVTSFPLDLINENVQIPYWNIACKHGKIAALNMVGIPTSVSKIIPFFWASFFDLKLRICGYIKNCDEVAIFTDPKVGLDAISTCFCALYRKKKQLTGALAVNCDPIASQIAADIAANKSFSISGFPSYIKERFPDCKPTFEIMEAD